MNLFVENFCQKSAKMKLKIKEGKKISRKIRFCCCESVKEIIRCLKRSENNN